MRVHDHDLGKDEVLAEYINEEKTIRLPTGDWVDWVGCSSCHTETPFVVIRHFGTPEIKCRNCHKWLVYRSWWEW